MGACVFVVLGEAGKLLNEFFTKLDNELDGFPGNVPRGEHHLLSAHCPACAAESQFKGVLGDELFENVACAL